MRLKDGVTEENRIYCQDYMLQKTKKSFPVMGVILVILALTLIFMWVTSAKISSERYGVGDPFHCKECKKIGTACKEHRGYDIENELEKEIDYYVLQYKPGETEEEEIQLLYGEGNSYNIYCDFCNEGNSECYGCCYERKRLRDLADSISETDLFISRICTDCWEMGYANCSSCRNMLAIMIKEKIGK